MSLQKLISNIEWKVIYQLNGKDKNYQFTCFAPTYMDAFGEFYISKGQMNVSSMRISKLSMELDGTPIIRKYIYKMQFVSLKITVSTWNTAEIECYDENNNLMETVSRRIRRTPRGEPERVAYAGDYLYFNKMQEIK